MTRRGIRFLEWVMITGILYFVLLATLHAQPTLPDPFPGYWRANNTTLPCSTVQPHLPAVDPMDGRQAYLRYDATATFVSPQPDGKRAGQGGSQHTVQVYLGGQLIGLCSGLACGSSTGPREMFPAPWANPTIPDYGIPLCDYWKAQALPGATLEVCPNPRTPAQYSAKVAGTSEWQAGWPLQAPSRARWCVPPRPTYTPPGPTVTPVPPSPTPTPGPDPAARFIEALERCGVTAGCGTDAQGRKLFCPDRNLTRREAAVWIAKALEMELTGCLNTFADVPCVNPTPAP